MAGITIYSQLKRLIKMVLRGVPFRDAYRIVAGKTGSGTFEATGQSDYSHIGTIGNTWSRLIKKRLEKIMVRFRKAYSPQELFDCN